MTFSTARYNKNYQYELVRYASIGNIVGGASKLFNHFVQTYNPYSIVSYADRRWNTGNLYLMLGMCHVSNSKPNYWYLRNYSTFEPRVKFQKHKLSQLLQIYDPNKTEWDNMIANGYDRYWDCGNAVFAWELSSRR